MSGRLADVDAVTASHLPPPGRDLALIDVGASSGTTSLDLLRAVTATGHQARMTISDLSLTARDIAFGPVYGALVDGEGRLIQHSVLGLPLRSWRRRLDYVTQFWLVTGAANRWYRRLQAQGAVAAALPHARTVLLVAPQVAAHPAVTCIEGDVFEAAPADQRGAFDVVRAANLLQPEVFPAERIVVAIAHLKARLRGPGALLILARSRRRGILVATGRRIYRLGSDERLVLAGRVGGGVDIEPLVGA